LDTSVLGNRMSVQANYRPNNYDDLCGLYSVFSLGPILKNKLSMIFKPKPYFDFLLNVLLKVK